MFFCDFFPKDSPSAFWTDFERNLNSLGYPRREALRQAAFVYDAVWMAAFALNTTSTMLRNGVVQGANQLEQFNHFLNETVSREINNIIRNAVQESNFQGVSVSMGQCFLNPPCIVRCDSYDLLATVSFLFISL